jgi:glutathione S-transferase
VPRLTVLNDQLKSRPYLLGPKFTIADLNLASIFSLVDLVKVDLAPYPSLKQWVDGCLSRPARVKLMA